VKEIVLETPGRLRLREVEPPTTPGIGEALVRVHRVGVCGTDYHAFRGRQPFFTYPRVLGHELGVEVVALGSPMPDLAVGDRCAVEPCLYCGHCSACRRGKTNCCENLQVLGVHRDGGMREYLVVPAANLHRSAILSLSELALVETLCIGAHAVARANLAPDEEVLVIGAGPIGLTVMQSALWAGARVTAMEVNEGRLAFCRSQWPEVVALTAGEEALAALAARRAGLPTVVFDATGNLASMMGAFSYLAQGGTLVYVGLAQGEVTFHDPDFHRREVTLLSSRNATGADFRRVIGHLERGALDLGPWLTHEATAEALVTTFPEWLDPQSGVIKALVTF
jgi:2-desacetyl-2-hydroxyethyl bacteriochlorophyllide A dehydrogenase